MGTDGIESDTSVWGRGDRYSRRDGVLEEMSGLRAMRRGRKESAMGPSMEKGAAVKNSTAIFDSDGLPVEFVR